MVCFAQRRKQDRTRRVPTTRHTPCGETASRQEMASALTLQRTAQTNVSTY